MKSSKSIFLIIALAAITLSCSDDNNDVESIYEDLTFSEIGTYTEEMTSENIDNSDNNRIAEGTVMAYRTSDNYLGKLVVVVNDGSNNNGLVFHHATYNDDAQIIFENENVEIRGTFSYSLDDAGDDFRLVNETVSTRHIEPLRGAEFTIVGVDPTFE